MNWALAITINRAALLRILAGLVAMVGQAQGGAGTMLPRPLYRAALALLRPLEAATRRLIVVAARGLVVKPALARPMPAGLVRAGRGGDRLSFQLFDSRKRFGRARFVACKAGPRVTGFASPLVPLAWSRPMEGVGDASDDPIDAARLGRRLQAAKLALDDLPRQARRLRRWEARRARMEAPKFRSALRPGLPPGHRKRPMRDIDRVLRECHALARDALRENSS